MFKQYVIEVTHNSRDFVATLEGYDGAPDSTGPYSMIGYGDTEAEAKANLLESLDWCDTCFEPLGNEDGPTCHHCEHSDCEDDPCQECIEFAADKYHDSMDQER